MATTKPTTNYSGAPSYQTTDAEQLRRFLTTGFMGRTYYATNQELDQAGIALFKRFAEIDPEFLANEIVSARKDGLLRLAPLTALVVLSSATNPVAKTEFHRIFRDVVQTPGDLQDVVRLCRGKTVKTPRAGTIRENEQKARSSARGEVKLRGMGPTMRRAVGDFLRELSEYHVIKYGSEHQDISLRDMYRLARPKLAPATRANHLAHYVTRGALVSDEFQQIAGYNAFKAAVASQDMQTALALVEQHRLPWEVVSRQFSALSAEQAKTVWSTMAPQMPHMALLRNVRNLLKYGALDDNSEARKIMDRLSSPEAVRTGKQLPFRYYSAIRAIEKSPEGSYTMRQGVLYALNSALYHAVTNLPDLGRTFVAMDVSNSMMAAVNTPVARSAMLTYAKADEVTCKDVAAIFATSVFLRSSQNTTVAFDENIYPRTKLSKNDTFTTIMRQITGTESGGTALWRAIEYALKDGKDYDAMFFFTDNESWVGELGGTDPECPFNSGYGYHQRYGAEHFGTTSERLLRAYVTRHPQTQVFFVNLMPYSHRVTPNDIPNVHYISGWSDSVLKYAQLVLSSREPVAA